MGLWAVHIADGVLTLPWLVGGFALAGLVAAWGTYRLRDEDIPRVALLAAAFFVASLLHVRLGPTSVHLLLNGLVGVVLGRRAALAIPLGLFLQAAIFVHGGFTTLGVNACVMILPAILSGWLFSLLHRVRWLQVPALRTCLVGGGALAATLGLVLLITVIATNRWASLLTPDLGPALAVLRHPATLAVAGVVAVVVGWGESRLHAAPEFALGLLVGVAAVVATITLNAVVLLLGGHEDWHQVVVLVIVAHLPLIPVEGVILGFTVSFLSRVKPELLGLEGQAPAWQSPAPSANGSHHATPDGITAAPRGSMVTGPPALLLAVAGMLLSAAPAQAHRLKADYELLPGGKVRVECYFDITGDAPAGARVQVFQRGDELLTEGKADDEGIFVFPYAGPGPLRVVANAGAGHRTECTIPADAFVAQGPPSDSTAPRTRRQTDISAKDVLLGVTFLLALAAFVLGVRNARRLRAVAGKLPVAGIDSAANRHVGQRPTDQVFADEP
jgi:cobalt/nickel transport system permease protein